MNNERLIIRFKDTGDYFVSVDEGYMNVVRAGNRDKARRFVSGESAADVAHFLWLAGHGDYELVTVDILRDFLQVPYVCYVCGGRTRLGANAHICVQEFGPCGWLTLNASGTTDRDWKRANTQAKHFWTPTRWQRKTRAPQKEAFCSLHTVLMIHVNPEGMDTMISDNVTILDERHTVEFK